MNPRSLRVIDSHTAGEPTRVVVEGGPDLGGGDMASRCTELRRSGDWLRTSLVTEPRGSQSMVGALLQPPVSTESAAGAIFFNNVGYLGMCGHGLIGVVVVLAHLDRLGPGQHVVETPAGNVTARLNSDGTVSFDNVVSYRHRAGVAVDVPGIGTVVGDVAWGGNWFFITATNQSLSLSGVSQLTHDALAIRHALHRQGITGRDGAEIDHIELVGPPGERVTADSRNFVLCPGGQYDRSPCGTGTSAKLACLAADGKWPAGKPWRQESILGGRFEASYRAGSGGIIPTITGRAFINAEATLIFDPHDPFRFGFPATLTNGASS